MKRTCAGGTQPPAPAGTRSGSRAPWPTWGCCPPPSPAPRPRTGCAACLAKQTRQRGAGTVGWRPLVGSCPRAGLCRRLPTPPRGLPSACWRFPAVGRGAPLPLSGALAPPACHARPPPPPTPGCQPDQAAGPAPRCPGPPPRRRRRAFWAAAEAPSPPPPPPPHPKGQACRPPGTEPAEWRRVRHRCCGCRRRC